jgi:predicted Rossmann fold nucleotide-binding protein DprA/Smf involved in DNA uptake
MPRRKGHVPRETITGGAPPYPLYRPVRVPVLRSGIRRRPYAPGPKRPLTERHLAILAALTLEPQGAAVLGRALGMSTSQAYQALYVLQARGLATRVGHRSGWVRVQNDGV